MPVESVGMNEGLIIMASGMGVVFSFLVVMVLAMSLMAKVMPVLAKIFPEVEPEEKGLKLATVQHDDIAVAIAAVKAYTKGK